MTTTLDVWGELHRIAVNGCAVIHVTDDPGRVVLVWSDGTQAELYWHGGEWQWEKILNREAR